MALLTVSKNSEAENYMFISVFHRLEGNFLLVRRRTPHYSAFFAIWRLHSLRSNLALAQLARIVAVSEEFVSKHSHEIFPRLAKSYLKESEVLVVVDLHS